MGWDGIGGLLSRSQHGLEETREGEKRPNGDQREGGRGRGVRPRSSAIRCGQVDSPMMTIRQEENQVWITAKREDPIHGKCSTAEGVGRVDNRDLARYAINDSGILLSLVRRRPESNRRSPGCW
jgi:hypothetical protein